MLTYGVVSNVNAALLVSFVWGSFSKAYGISPLSPGAWQKFLPFYFGIYATLGTVLRPLRLAAAVSLTPVYAGVIRWVQDRLPLYRTSNPKLNRTIAVVLVSLIGNTLGTCAITAGGVQLAGFLTGVPAFPPGWRWPGAPA